MVQHIAYYNDPIDIKELMDKDAKSIVKYFKKGLGAYLSSADPNNASVKGCRPVMVGKEKWYVKKSISKNDLDGCDNYIDLFKVVSTHSNYAPKKPKKPKAKKENEKVYLVTAAYQKDGGDLDYTSNIGVYKSKEGATKALIDVAIEYLPVYDCDRAIIGYNNDDYTWGEWDNLAVTADKKGDPDDDDYYDLSQEEILELIRKAGRILVETETHSGMELKIVETDLEP